MATFRLLARVAFFSVVLLKAVYMQAAPTMKSLCDAQCEALCLEDVAMCNSFCHVSYPRIWALKCYAGSMCNEGSCIFLRQDGFVPPRPDFAITRDLLKQVITLHWNVPAEPYKIIYDIEMQEEDQQSWMPLGWVFGDHYTIADPSGCHNPVFRIAAVSRYGSRGYSNPVRTPGIPLGPVSSIAVSELEYIKDNYEVSFNITWQIPLGWHSEDIIYYHVDNVAQYCKNQWFPVLVYVRHYPASETENIRISEPGINCSFTFQIQAVAKCKMDTVGPGTNFTIFLDDHHIKGYTPMVITPGPVVNVTATARATCEGLQVDVKWLPPEDVGSGGYIKGYTLRWGKVIDDDDDEPLPYLVHDQIITVPGDTRNYTIQLPKDMVDTVGVQVLAMGPEESDDVRITRIHHVHLRPVPDCTVPVG